MKCSRISSPSSDERRDSTTSLLPARPIRTAAFGALLWLSGIVVGGVVFATPALKAVPAIPYVTANPFITVPILALWTILAWVLPRGSVAQAARPRVEGLRIGMMFLAVNVVLDLMLVVGLMKTGPGFYGYGGLWSAYALLVVVPWLTGRSAGQRRGPQL
jgi:hypothetical protein